MIRPAVRKLRTSVPARALLVFVVLALLLLRWKSSPRVTFNEQDLEFIWTAPRDEVADRYESRRLALLLAERYDPHAAARSVGSPTWTEDGHPSLNAAPETYAARLGTFVFNYLNLAPMRSRLDHAVGRVHKHVPPTVAEFPRKVSSTDRLGDAGVPDMFRLWGALLPLPLGGALDELVPQTQWADPTRKGAPWAVMVADWTVVTTQLSAWVGDSIRGSGDWAQFWNKIGSGDHRSQVFKYMTMLFEGGLFANTDAVPIAHPYLWGLGAIPKLHPDLELIRKVLVKHALSSDSTHRRLWERSHSPQPNWTVPLNVWEQPDAPDDVRAVDNEINEINNDTDRIWTPPYPSHQRLAKRAPFFGPPPQPDEAASILSPQINLVAALDWDSSIAFRLSSWRCWSFARLKRSLSAGRSLQFSSNVVLAKPFHPVFLDTVATIWAQVASGGLETQDPLELSGDGPFTDAVLRYLLVRYGVTPRQLRNLKGPVRIGDVLILQEGALSAPPVVVDKMLSYVQEFFPSLPGSGLAQAVPGRSLWYWGAGFQRWWSCGRRVANLEHVPAADMPKWDSD